MVKRLLCIIGSMGAGGAETMLMKIYRTIMHDGYQMDFIVFNPQKGFYDEEIVTNGGKIYYMPSLKDNPIASLKYLYQIARKHNYKYAMLSSEWSFHIILLWVAKIAGVKRLVIRSTNSNTGRGRGANVLHRLFKLFYGDGYIKLAPSTEAAEFMFGVNCIRVINTHILKNGINLHDFHFDDKKRDIKRDEVGIRENEFLIGHIGRFESQKNHRLIIETFRKIKEKNILAKLLLVGRGSLLNATKDLVNTYKLNDSVIFLENRKDVPELLMAMDVMIFPSFFEGMPNVVVEAQATGLPCVVSDSVTKECRLTDLVDFISVKNNPATWCDAVLKAQHKMSRDKYNQMLKYSGYDIKDVSKNFVKYVFDD